MVRKDDKQVALTPAGVLCFADGLFKARSAAPGGKPRYSAILLFNKIGTGSEAYQNLRRACVVAITEKWGAAKASDPNFTRTLRLPFRNAADKSYEGFEEGEIYIAPWKDGEQDRPQIINLRGEEILSQGEVWSGQLARASVRAFAYEQSGNRGVNFGLEHIQIVKSDMPRLDGRRTASEAFKNADNADLIAMGIDPNAPAAATDPTTKLLDDIPF